MATSVERIQKYVRAANYLVVSQLYLQDNFLLERPLAGGDIKPRLLGHWGTCPGINFTYANLNWLTQKYKLDMMFVLGPGHGFPALQANLFLEGTLNKYYPEATQDLAGIAYISKQFSWPYGFPSHSSPATPGVILEGGELGYALATSYGAILDNPNLIAACLIGDGEAETGPTAAAWHLNKFLDPATNGAVLPILHLNGYKISGPTIFGRMSNKELKVLFNGYGYEPLVVEGVAPFEKMMSTLDVAHKMIRAIQHKARTRKKLSAPAHFPMIILRTPKGWTGIKSLHGQKIEDNHLSHQIVAPNAKTDPEELTALERWLKSYRFHELFDARKGFSVDVLSLVPEKELRLGDNMHGFGGRVYKPLKLPKAEKFEEDAKVPGTIGSSSMRRAGLYLKEVVAKNERTKNFRFFSPDETYSNKLDAIFSETSRAFVWPHKSWDKDLAPQGRVIEILSEHSLQGLAQGYLLTGRHAVFASYEAFIQIIGSMADQYVKFLRQAAEVPWRGDIASLNYILTSSGWRQEHNGFSHQNPGFVSTMLEKQGDLVRVYFPPDGNSMLAVLERCLQSKNGINVIVAGKTQEPRWLTVAAARKELERGIATWKFASDKYPDIVFCGIGDYMTKEALAAIDILKYDLPGLKMRFVNVVELSAMGIGNEKSRAQFGDFEEFFTADKPVIINFHGYPEAIKPMLMEQKNSSRFRVHGYIENGSTTTPFDMQVRNETSRYHLALEALSLLRREYTIPERAFQILTDKYQTILKKHREYIIIHGVDPESIEQWQWTRNT